MGVYRVSDSDLGGLHGVRISRIFGFEWEGTGKHGSTFRPRVRV